MHWAESINEVFCAAMGELRSLWSGVASAGIQLSREGVGALTPLADIVRCVNFIIAVTTRAHPDTYRRREIEREAEKIFRHSLPCTSFDIIEFLSFSKSLKSL